MSVFIGQVVVSTELMNKVVKPLILNQQSVLSDIEFRVDRGAITFRARGKYFVQFRAEGAARIISFNFGPGGHNLTLAVEIKLYPRVLDLFARNPLEIIFAGQPGMRIKGTIMQIDLREVPWVASIGKTPVGGADIFSWLEVAFAGKSEAGLLFNFSLAEHAMTPQQEPAGN
ncbi:MAG TPA: hypothetical protein PLZ49_09825 [Bacillota bacterium]|nr:hypothetical protein [Bacillota bacterium]